MAKQTPEIGDRVEFTVANPALTGTGNSPYVVQQTKRLRGTVVAMEPPTDEDPWYTVLCESGEERLVRGVSFHPDYSGTRSRVL